MPASADPAICLTSRIPADSGWFVKADPDEKKPDYVHNAPKVKGLIQMHMSDATVDMAGPAGGGADLRLPLLSDSPGNVARMSMTLSPAQSGEIQLKDAQRLVDQYNVYLDLPNRRDLIDEVRKRGGDLDRFLPITPERDVTDWDVATSIRLIPEKHLLESISSSANTEALKNYGAMRGQLRLIGNMVEIGVPKVEADALQPQPAASSDVLTAPIAVRDYAELMKHLDGLAKGSQAKVTATAGTSTYDATALMHEGGVVMSRALPRRPNTITVSLPAPVAASSAPAASSSVGAVSVPAASSGTAAVTPAAGQATAPASSRSADVRAYAQNRLAEYEKARQFNVDTPVGFRTTTGSLGWGERGRVTQIDGVRLEDIDKLAKNALSSTSGLPGGFHGEFVKRYKTLGPLEFGRKLTGVGVHLWDPDSSRYLTVQYRFDSTKLTPIPAEKVDKGQAGEVTGTSIDPGYNNALNESDVEASKVTATLPLEGTRLFFETPHVPWVQLGAPVGGGLEPKHQTSDRSHAYTAQRSLILSGAMTHFRTTGDWYFDNQQASHPSSSSPQGDTILSFPVEHAIAKDGAANSGVKVDLRPGDSAWASRTFSQAEATPESISGLPELAVDIVKRLGLSNDRVRNDIEDWVGSEALKLESYLNLLGPKDLTPVFEGGGKKFAFKVGARLEGVERMDDRQNRVIKDDVRVSQQQGSGEARVRSINGGAYVRGDVTSVAPADKAGVDLKGNISGGRSTEDQHSSSSAEGLSAWNITDQAGTVAVYKVTMKLMAEHVAEKGAPQPLVTRDSVMVVHVPLAQSEAFEASLSAVGQGMQPPHLALLERGQASLHQKYLPDDIEYGRSIENGFITGMPGFEQVIPKLIDLVRAAEDKMIRTWSQRQQDGYQRRTELELHELARMLGPLYDPFGLRANQTVLYNRPQAGDTSINSFGLPHTVTRTLADNVREHVQFRVSLSEVDPRNHTDAGHFAHREGFSSRFSGPTSEAKQSGKRTTAWSGDLSGRGTVALNSRSLRQQTGLTNVGWQGGTQGGIPRGHEVQAGQSTMLVHAMSQKGKVYPFAVPLAARLEVKLIREVTWHSALEPLGQLNKVPDSDVVTTYEDISGMARISVPEAFTVDAADKQRNQAVAGSSAAAGPPTSTDPRPHPATSAQAQRPAPATSSNASVVLDRQDRITGLLNGQRLAGELRANPPSTLSLAQLDNLERYLANPEWLKLVIFGDEALPRGSGVTLTAELSNLRKIPGAAPVPGRFWSVWLEGKQRAVGDTKKSDHSYDLPGASVPRLRQHLLPNAYEFGKADSLPSGGGLLPAPNKIKSGSHHADDSHSRQEDVGLWQERDRVADQFLVDVTWVLTIGKNPSKRVLARDVRVLRPSDDAKVVAPQNLPHQMPGSNVPAMSSTRRLERVPTPGVAQQGANQQSPVTQLVKDFLARNNAIDLMGKGAWKGWESSDSEYRELSNFTSLVKLQSLMPSMLGAGTAIMAKNGDMLFLQADRIQIYDYHHPEPKVTDYLFRSATATSGSSKSDTTAQGYHWAPFAAFNPNHDIFSDLYFSSVRLHVDLLARASGSTTGGSFEREMHRKFIEMKGDAHEYRGKVEISAYIIKASLLRELFPSAVGAVVGAWRRFVNGSGATKIGSVVLGERVSILESSLADGRTWLNRPLAVALGQQARARARQADLFPVHRDDVLNNRLVVHKFEPVAVRGLWDALESALQTSRAGQLVKHDIGGTNLRQIIDQLDALDVVLDALTGNKGYESKAGRLNGNDFSITVSYKLYDAQKGKFTATTVHSEIGGRPGVLSGKQHAEESRIKIDAPVGVSKEYDNGKIGRSETPFTAIGSYGKSNSSTNAVSNTFLTPDLFRKHVAPYLLTKASVFLTVQMKAPGTLFEESFEESFWLPDAAWILVNPENALAKAGDFSPKNQSAESYFKDGVPTAAGHYFPANNAPDVEYHAASAHQSFDDTMVVPGSYDPATDHFSGDGVVAFSRRLVDLLGSKKVVVIPVGGVGDVGAFYPAPAGGTGLGRQRSFAARLVDQLNKDAKRQDIRVIAPAHLDDVLQTTITPTSVDPNPRGQLLAGETIPPSGPKPASLARMGSFVEHRANGLFRPLDADLTDAMKVVLPASTKRDLVEGTSGQSKGHLWLADRSGTASAPPTIVDRWASGEVVGAQQGDQPPNLFPAGKTPAGTLYVRSGTRSEQVFTALDLMADPGRSYSRVTVITVDQHGARVAPHYSGMGGMAVSGLFRTVANRRHVDVEFHDENGKRYLVKPSLSPAPPSTAAPSAQAVAGPSKPRAAAHTPSHAPPKEPMAVPSAGKMQANPFSGGQGPASAPPPPPPPATVTARGATVPTSVTRNLPAEWQVAYDAAWPHQLRTERFVPAKDLVSEDSSLLRGEVTTIDFRVREFRAPDGTKVRAFDVHLDLVSRNDLVTPDARAEYGRAVQSTVNQMVNHRHRFADGFLLHLNFTFATPTWRDGLGDAWTTDRRLSPAVEVTDDPSVKTNQLQWKTTDSPAVGVHEIMHFLGAKEGYSSSGRLFATPDRRGVMGADVHTLPTTPRAGATPYLDKDELAVIAEVAVGAARVQDPGPAAQATALRAGDSDLRVGDSDLRVGDSDLGPEPEWLRTSLARVERPYQDSPNLLSDVSVPGARSVQPPASLRSAARTQPEQYFVWLSTRPGAAVERPVLEWLNERLEQLAQAGRTPVVVTRGRITSTAAPAAGPSSGTRGTSAPDLLTLLATYGVPVIHQVPHGSGASGGLNVDNSWRVTPSTRGGPADTDADSSWPRVSLETVAAARRMTRPTDAVQQSPEAFGSLVWGAQGVREQFVLLRSLRDDLLDPANVERAARMAERVPASMNVALVKPLLRFGPDEDIVARFAEAPPAEQPSTLLKAVFALDGAAGRAAAEGTDVDGRAIAQVDGVSTGDFVDLVKAVRLGEPDVERYRFDFAVSVLETVDMVKAGKFAEAEAHIEKRHKGLDGAQKLLWVDALNDLHRVMTDNLQRANLDGVLAAVLKC